MLTDGSGGVATASSRHNRHTASVAVGRTSHNNEFIRVASVEDELRREWAADDLRDRSRQRLNALTSDTDRPSRRLLSARPDQKIRVMTCSHRSPFLLDDGMTRQAK